MQDKPESKKNDVEIKWCSLDNEDASASMLPHAFIKNESKNPYTGDAYIGNRCLCNKRFCVSEDGEGSMLFKSIEDFQTLPPSGACKKCLKIFNKTQSKNESK